MRKVLNRNLDTAKKNSNQREIFKLEKIIQRHQEQIKKKNYKEEANNMAKKKKKCLHEAQN